MHTRGFFAPSFFFGTSSGCEHSRHLWAVVCECSSLVLRKQKEGAPLFLAQSSDKAHTLLAWEWGSMGEKLALPIKVLLEKCCQWYIEGGTSSSRRLNEVFWFSATFGEQGPTPQLFSEPTLRLLCPLSSVSQRLTGVCTVSHVCIYIDLYMSLYIHAQVCSGQNWDT